MRTALIAGLAALFSAPAFAQDVHMGIGANGQMTGSVSAGGSSTSVSTGNTMSRRDRDYRDNRGDYRNNYRDSCRGGGSRTTTVVSPDGSSSSSVSVSGNGVMSTGGSGSPGSRVYQSGCPEDRGDRGAYYNDPAPQYRQAAQSRYTTRARHNVHHRSRHRSAR